MPNINIDDLRDAVDEFESAVRNHENIGSQPIEDHEAIEEEYQEAEKNLIGALVDLHSNPASAVIAYIMDENNVEDNDDAMAFLNYWNEGEFDILRRNWKNIPDEVFIGAEVGFVPGNQQVEIENA